MNNLIWFKFVLFEKPLRETNSNAFDHRKKVFSVQGEIIESQYRWKWIENSNSNLHLPRFEDGGSGRDAWHHNFVSYLPVRHRSRGSWLEPTRKGKFHELKHDECAASVKRTAPRRGRRGKSIARVSASPREFLAIARRTLTSDRRPHLPTIDGSQLIPHAVFRLDP